MPLDDDDLASMSKDQLLRVANTLLGAKRPRFTNALPALKAECALPKAECDDLPKRTRLLAAKCALDQAGMTIEELRRALVHENELRLCEETQRAYAEAEASNETDWMEVTGELQRRVLSGAGVADENMDAALYLLRSASKLFPEQPDFGNQIYVKFQRAKQGALRSGDIAPDVFLHDMQAGRGSSLALQCEGALPTVLVAGSYT